MLEDIEIGEDMWCPEYTILMERIRNKRKRTLEYVPKQEKKSKKRVRSMFEALMDDTEEEKVPLVDIEDLCEDMGTCYIGKIPDDISYDESVELMRKIHNGEELSSKYNDLVNEHKLYVEEGLCRNDVIEQVQDVEVVSGNSVVVFSGNDSLNELCGHDGVFECQDTDFSMHVHVDSLSDPVKGVLYDLSRQTGIECGKVSRGVVEDNVEELCNRNIMMKRGDTRIYLLGVIRGYGNESPIFGRGFKIIGVRWDLLRFSNGETYLYYYDRYEGHKFRPVNNAECEIYFYFQGKYYAPKAHQIHLNSFVVNVKKLPSGEDFYSAAGAFYLRNGEKNKIRMRTLKDKKVKAIVMSSNDPMTILCGAHGPDLRCLTRYMRLCGWFFKGKWCRRKTVVCHTICPRIKWRASTCGCSYPTVNTCKLVLEYVKLKFGKHCCGMTFDGVYVCYDPDQHDDICEGDK